MDIRRVAGGWLVKVELAGVRREDVRLSCNGRWLRVWGVRRDEEPCAVGQFYSMEIAYSRFHRLIEFPVSVEGARIETSYRDGMLSVRLSTGEDDAGR